MRLRRRMSPSEGENVLPLINVVFLLLVFFMVAGALERADIYDVEPPQSASEAETDAGENVLLMASDGRLALDGVALDRPTWPTRCPTASTNRSG